MRFLFFFVAAVFFIGIATAAAAGLNVRAGALQQLVYEDGDFTVTNLNCAPEGLTAQGVAGPEVMLAWSLDDPDEECGVPVYRIYRCIPPTDCGVLGNYTLLDTSATTDYVDTDVLDGGTYWYLVTAVYGGSFESDPSNTAEATVPVGP